MVAQTYLQALLEGVVSSPHLRPVELRIRFSDDSSKTFDGHALNVLIGELLGVIRIQQQLLQPQVPTLVSSSLMRDKLGREPVADDDEQKEE